ncbi:angiopoietin-related protein 1-like [Anopheles aquasalis]|uniref:angiopoietin-related protein 1-like n=1 Tax=Anopheles aquasalis TaxID=42839 RepID=UPI00215AA28C|nr:angiopoietin-related protein 1-like [Anopheles aquasalis]
MTKLEYLQQELSSMKSQVLEQGKEITKGRAELSKKLTEQISEVTENQTKVSQWQKDVEKSITSIRDQQDRTFKLLENTKNKIQKQQEEMGNILSNMARMHFGSFPSCKDVPMKVSGAYFIRANERTPPFSAYCEQDTMDGGWVVIQQRTDRQLSFDVSWDDYRNGFGSAEGDVWIGLERMHHLTSTKNWDLLVEMKDFEGNYKHARYSDFKIGSEAEKYRLKSLGTYSGNAGDALKKHLGSMFTTKDRDNDEKQDQNCAEKYKGGWWYKDCLSANLNGVYASPDDLQTSKITWYWFGKDWRRLSYTRMMIRPL